MRDVIVDASIAQCMDVRYRYRRDVPLLEGVDLTVARTRILALLGPNGSGKSTLLKLIAGVLRPASGTVRVSGNVGYVPQLASTTFAYTVLDLVLLGRARAIGTFSMPSRRDVEMAHATLERLELSALAPRAFDTLSGGERQLVLLARALASEADLLVLDEPTAALDLAHQELVLQTMRAVCSRDGVSVLFTTHHPDHAAAIADDVALMTRGSLTQGDVDAMLTPERVESVFGVPMTRIAVPTDDPQVIHGSREAAVLVPRWRFDR